MRGLDQESIAEAFDAAGLSGVLLTGAPLPPTAQPGYRPIQVLVARDRRSDARSAFGKLAWRYSWLRHGLGRLQPGYTYWSDAGDFLDLLWGLPAAPFPAARLDRLAARLLAGSGDGPLRAAEPEALAVHLAVQVCRPGRGHQAEWDRLRLLASGLDWPAVRQIAVETGVVPALERARRRLDAPQPPGPGPLFGGILAPAWRAALGLQGHARPARLRRLLAGAPAWGDLAVRVRSSGIELIVPPGVFVPMASVDAVVEVALANTMSLAQPVVLEVGTGCGAIALAIAARRPPTTVFGTDLSRPAVRAARDNAARLALRATFERRALLEGMDPARIGPVDCLIANLPYVPPERQVALGSVPPAAVQGIGDDGLGLQRQLARDARRFLRHGGALVLQMLPRQWDEFADELAALGYRATERVDLGGHVIGVARFEGAAPI